MKKYIRLLSFVLVLVLALSITGCAKKEESGKGGTRTVTDHAGNQVEVPTEINRIVVADIYPMPSVLTIFFDSAEKIVGMAPASMTAAQNSLLGELYPEILNAETSFTDGSDVNIEELIKLEPDIVFYSASNAEVGEKLKNAGIPGIAGVLF